MRSSEFSPTNKIRNSKYINKLTARGLFASHQILRNFAKELTKKQPGKHWHGRFLKRQQDDLILTYTTAIDAARTAGI
jgi:hypothetical protein